jgi:colanic acid biosynthesis glycosyl transferase WcaI
VSKAIRPLKLAIVGINYAPEEIGIARYTSDMAVELAARGHAVEVIAGKPYYPQWAIYPEFKGLDWRKSVERGVKITRVPFYVPGAPSGLKRILHLASFALAALVPVLGLVFRGLVFGGREDRPDVVICVAPALLSVPVAWLAARLTGAKLWVHVQDFEVEAAFATGLVDGGGKLAGLARFVENGLLGLADRVSTISPQMCAKLREKGVAAERVVEIRNWADAGFVADVDEGAAYRAEWGLGQRKLVLYSGNIANKQGIEIIVEAARILAGRDDIGFVICGQGPNRVRLEELAAGLNTMQFHDLQPMARMGELLCLAAVHILPQIPGAADLVLPSKLTNMLASGRPVVATAEAGTGLFDEVDGCGICTNPGDAAAIAAAIAGLMDDAPRRMELGAAAKMRAKQRWSQEAILDRLEHELGELR